MDCRICGRQFDPLGYQVVVPGLSHGFDRVDCALEASAVDLPESRRIEPEPAVVRELPPAFAAMPAFAGGPMPAASAQSVRPQFLAGANLALLAVATVATIYLWLRVFGADAGPFSFSTDNASDAYGRTAIAAAIDLTPDRIRVEPEDTIRGEGAPLANLPGASAASDRATASDRRSKKSAHRRDGGPVVRPAQPAPAPEPPSQPTPSRTAPTPSSPVPSSPPDHQVPGPTIPNGPTTEQPALPGIGGGRP
jgi:hypothetical protein